MHYLCSNQSQRRPRYQPAGRVSLPSAVYSVQCDLCGNWYHAFCQDITKGAYNALKRHTILSFICDLRKKLPTYAKLQPGPQLSDTAVQVSPSHDQPQPNVIFELVKKVGDLEMAMKNHLLAMASTTPQQLGATQVPPQPLKEHGR